mmetsp:Transcript_19815/g.64423  ORF Transcript_19815/g.64423 Transcript_19815/m.64423 type:complete len:167 (+) Transcript_19815:1-501(+)
MRNAGAAAAAASLLVLVFAAQITRAVDDNSSVLQLTSQNWNKARDDNRLYVVKFYIDHCGHWYVFSERTTNTLTLTACLHARVRSKRLAPIWERLGATYSGDERTVIATVDCGIEQSICRSMDVQAFPAVRAISGGVVRREFKGARELSELRQFIRVVERDLGLAE